MQVSVLLQNETKLKLFSLLGNVRNGISTRITTAIQKITMHYISIAPFEQKDISFNFR